jgi:hypothetical protein
MNELRNHHDLRWQVRNSVVSCRVGGESLRTGARQARHPKEGNLQQKIAFATSHTPILRRIC